MRRLLDVLTPNRAKGKHVIMQQSQQYLDQQEVLERHAQTFRLRFAQAEDMETLMRLQEDGYQGFQAWRYRDFVYDYHHNPYCVYLLLEEIQSKEVVGMITGRFLAKGAHISHLIVQTSHQRLGLGNYLLTAWIELVAQHQLPKITLEVRQSNEVAQRLYRAHRFIKIKDIPFYYDDNQETAYFMCRYM